MPAAVEAAAMALVPTPAPMTSALATRSARVMAAPASSRDHSDNDSINSSGQGSYRQCIYWPWSLSIQEVTLSTNTVVHP